MWYTIYDNFKFNLTHKNIGFQENKIDNKETIALLLHDKKDALKEWFHILGSVS